MNDLSLHIIDIIQNSISAGAKAIKLIVVENLIDDKLIISVEDNGKGIERDKLKQLADPFFTSRTTRKVGLGIPLFKQSAVQSGGDLVIESEVGVGTKVTASFVNSHIDRPPLGDLPNTVVLMISSNPSLFFEFKYIFNHNEFSINTDEINEALGGSPIYEPSVIRYLTELIRENIEELKHGDQ